MKASGIDFEEDIVPPYLRPFCEADEGRRAVRHLAIPIRSMFEDLRDEHWSEEILLHTRKVFVQALCWMLGSPVHGNLDFLVMRLLALRQVYLKLIGFGVGDYRRLADTYNREQLRWMAKECRLWRFPRKTVIASLLLRWRDQHRAEAEDFMTNRLSKFLIDGPRVLQVNRNSAPGQQPQPA